MKENLTLFVDLDNTLVKTDVLWEKLVAALIISPKIFVAAVFWLLTGKKVQAKKILSHEIKINVSLLPYNQAVLDLIKKFKEAGNKVYLATATHDIVAKKIADYLGCFDGVVASKDQNLAAENKLNAIKEIIKNKPFAYIGDSKQDLPIWKAAKVSYIVETKSFKDKGLNLISVNVSKPSIFKSIFHLMRPHQWAKNTLIFLPLLSAHKFDLLSFMACLYGFVIMSFLASSIYIFNDLIDLEDDRSHHKKKERALANGSISIFQGLLIGFTLIAFSFAMMLTLPYNAIGILLVYFILSQSYSIFFKKKCMVDVFVLSLLYTIRVIFGHALINVSYSPWILAFCQFLFLGLAFAKRVAELYTVLHNNQKAMNRRGYHPEDYNLMLIFGIVTSVIAPLIIMLYANSQHALELYSHPHYLMLISPVMTIWISRLWLVTNRGQMHHDPVFFAVTDLISYIVGVISFLTAWAAI